MVRHPSREPTIVLLAVVATRVTHVLCTGPESVGISKVPVCLEKSWSRSLLFTASGRANLLQQLSNRT